jgi:hypothetical protein
MLIRFWLQADPGRAFEDDESAQIFIVLTAQGELPYFDRPRDGKQQLPELEGTQLKIDLNARVETRRR